MNRRQAKKQIALLTARRVWADRGDGTFTPDLLSPRDEARLHALQCYAYRADDRWGRRLRALADEPGVVVAGTYDTFTATRDLRRLEEDALRKAGAKGRGRPVWLSGGNGHNTVMWMTPALWRRVRSRGKVGVRR